MGNVGNSKAQIALYHLNRKEFNKIDPLIEKYPEILEAAVTKDSKQTLLMKAVSNGSLESVQYMLSKNANVNAVTPKGQTALSLAVKKNRLEIVKKLIESGGNADWRNSQGFSMIDYAILPGFLQIAQFLYERIKDRQLKAYFEYQFLGKKYQYRYVNYKKFLKLLTKEGEEGEIEENMDFLKKQKVKLNDPVPDPRQNWKEWFKRNLQFQEAPLVERSDLPECLQPQNRTLGKVDVLWTNWSRIEGRSKVSYKIKDTREVMSEMAEVNTSNKLSQQEDKREIQTAS